MKYNLLYLIRRMGIQYLAFGLCLCGFLFGWLDGIKGPVLPSSSIKLSEKQALWSRFLGYTPEGHTPQLSTFAQNGSLMIAQQTKRLFALEARSGHILWKRNFNHRLTNPCATDQKRIFLTTSEPRLLALDTQTGALIWSVSLPHITLAKVAVDQTQVIVKTISGEVLAFNTKNGKPLWQYKHSSSSMMLHTSSAPQLSENQLLVGFPDGKLLAFDRTHGDLLWEHSIKPPEFGLEFDKLVDIAADPIIDKENSVIYVSTYHGMLQCLDLVTGDIKWERPFSGYMPLLLGKHLYTVDDNHIVYAFNKSDGSIVWQQNTFKDHQASHHNYRIVGPALTSQGNQLILTDEAGYLYWLDSKNGNIIGSAAFNIESPILSLPLVQNNTVYAMNRRSQVVAWENLSMPLNAPMSSNVA